MNDRRSRSRRYSSGALISAIAVIVVSIAGALHLLLPDIEGMSPAVSLMIETGTLATGTSIALWFLIIRPLRDAAGREDLESMLHRALEMAGDEQAAYQSIDRTLNRGVGRLAVELLLADSSDAHLKRAVASGGPDGRGPGCAVGSPRDCPAVRRAQTLVFGSSEAIDACPHLEGREIGVCSAVCVPVSVAGRSIGVLHAATSINTAATQEEIGRLEALANHGGARLGMLRVMEQTHLQAATDPLTGLLNRRAFENQAQERLRRGTPFALAMGDLDHFKLLNDTFGHEAGDRALRLFARVVRESMRSEDLVCRFGGEEFVFVFPGLSAPQAAAVLERLRDTLRATTATGSVPAFTVSFGVAHSDDAPELDDLFRIADAALFRAKREGRDRVVIDSIDADAAQQGVAA